MESLREKKIIKLPSCKKKDWRRELPENRNKAEGAEIEIDCNDWLFGCRELKQLINTYERIGFEISCIYSIIPETIISASSLGINAQLIIPISGEENKTEPNKQSLERGDTSLVFQKGTLRSGEHFESEGSILLLGDVNPGAKISAGGDIMIWGRLMGTAHAGKDGREKVKIVALELRPLQLRIASKIARGPEEKPKPGLAEEAKIRDGRIIIEPANPHFFRKSER